MTALHPNGVNHLALSTRDMKGQLEFWCDVLGLPLKALYWMHGVDGTYHGFVELAPDSYVAFVQHPDNAKDIELGVTHAGGPGEPVTAGTMQHVAFNVDTFDGFIQSIYFAGPEGLALEVACGSAIPVEQWVDPEVQDLCGISAAELEQLKYPVEYSRPVEPVPQPSGDTGMPRLMPEDHYDMVMSLPDQVVWDRMSETTPPVAAD
ncbi:VOC family protein [Candidatus Poriferisodalis multihospitum]|uniref:VOC family protein n=1 Tax=Candidatus Poriferisodalis multihospitum TaxID=2983191 RepID=UPI002B264037|nr:VOC family protein [Candidatus Poriferisodalis multihospitum]